MQLYHGSSNGDIKQLKPQVSNHEKEYVYFITHEVLAILYAYNPIERPGGFYTYKFDKNGQVYYDEFFPDQLKKIYQGKSGYVYSINNDDYNLQHLEKMPWVYLSEKPIKVDKPKFIKDIYEEILLLEKQGKIIVNRYEAMSEELKQKNRSVIVKDIEMKNLKNRKENSYAKFLHEHFPDLI